MMLEDFGDLLPLVLGGQILPFLKDSSIQSTFGNNVRNAALELFRIFILLDETDFTWRRVRLFFVRGIVAKCNLLIYLTVFIY